MVSRRGAAAVVLGVAAALAAPGSASARPPLPQPVLVSVGLGGQPANDASNGGVVANRGRVAFVSSASNLVPGDDNGQYDVFVRDTPAGPTIHASASSTGAFGSQPSSGPDISANGRFVAFTSLADGLVPGDHNGAADVFVRDLRTGALQIASVGTNGEPGNASSLEATVSDDGRWVAFLSDATNLVPEPGQFHYGVYLRDLRGGVTTRVVSGASEPSIDGRARHVAYTVDSGPANRIYVQDLRTGATELASVDVAGRPGPSLGSQPALSRNGRVVAFIAPGPDGLPPSPPGRFHGVHVFVRDLRAAVTEQVDVSDTGAGANATSLGPVISADGRWAGFTSYASNLGAGLPGGTNGFVRDRRKRTTRWVTADPEGDGLPNPTTVTSLSPNGRLVAFEALHSIPPGTNNFRDVFVLRLR